MMDFFKDQKNNLLAFHCGIRSFILCGLLVCSISSTTATELYKWIDSDGNVTYQDTAPPSNVSYEEQTYADPSETLREEVNLSIESAAEESPVSFYSVPSCDSCDLVRLYLEKNVVPFTEKKYTK